MSKTSRFLLAATLLLALAACSETDVDLRERVTEVQAQAKGGKKKIVEEPSATMSPCTALYSGERAQATTTNAVVDPAIGYGAVGT